MNAITAYDPETILADIGFAAKLDGPLEEGHSGTPVWKITTAAGARATLRVFEEDEKESVDRLIMIHGKVRGEILVAEILAATTWANHPVLVLSWIPGNTLRQAITHDPASAADLGRQFGQLQARFNSILIPATFPDFDAEVAGLLREWDPALATAFVAAKGDSGLLHLDYHLLNVLADGGQITGVIDWVNAGVVM